MSKNLKQIITENKAIKFIVTKIKNVLYFFHIPTILGHDKLSFDENPDSKSEQDKNKDTAKEATPEKNLKSQASQKVEEGFNKVIVSFDNVYNKYGKEQTEIAVLKNSKNPLKIGLYIICGFFGIMFTWMLFAKIDGSVVAQGQVVFAQNKQNIQHQTGGVIKSILVKEGDLVHYGQVLMTLNDSDLRANYNISYNKVFNYMANRIRLIAERDGIDHLEFNNDMIKASKENKDLSDILNTQERLFNANNELFKNRIQIIQDKKAQLKADIENIESQKVLLKQRTKYVEELLGNAEKLLVDGGVPKARLLELKSQRDSLLQDEQRFSGAISNSQAQILNLEEEEIVFKSNRLKETEDAIRDSEINVNLEQQKVNALQDSLDKDIIKAPFDGVINNLKYKNSGEVIQPSSVIMEIVPHDEYLVIEGKLMSKEINSLLSTGLDLFSYNHQNINHLLDAKVNLVSYSNRRYKKLRGSVFYVATDIATDPKYGFTYYLVKVMISKKELEYATSKNMKLFPGMPAEVYILSGQSRTPFSYLISPITASMDKAFIDS